MDSTAEQARSKFWESLRQGFAKLREECAINPPLVPAGQLSAIWESQPEAGSWRLNYRSGNDGLGIAQRFRWHAASGAARLGFQGDTDAGLAYWLNAIKKDAPKSHARYLMGGGSLESIELLDICALSADYCRKCEADEAPQRHNWLESLPKDDPNYDVATRFELKAWADSWGLVADGLGGRLSFADFVEGCANTFSQAAEAHVGFNDEAPISEKCNELDRSADLFIEQFENELRSASDRIGQPEVEEAVGALSKKVHEILARSKQRIYQAAAAQKAERTQELPVDTVPQAPAKGNSSEPAVPARRIQRHFRKVGEIWSVSFDGKTVSITHRLGMTYIGELLRSPGRSLNCLALQASVGRNLDSRVQPEEDREVQSPIAGFQGEEVLDKTALKQYKDRLDSIDAELLDAERNRDTGRREKLADEKEMLVDQLKSVTGLLGRPRRFATDAEKARKAVSHAINRALDRIKQHHPALAKHLLEHIELGISCRYEGDDVPWDF